MKLLKRAAQTLFSAHVWASSFTVMGGFAGAMIFVRPFMSWQRFNHAIAAPVVGVCVRSTFSRVNIHTAPDFDPKRASLFCQNHVSLLDGPLACIAIPTPFCGMMLAWHFKIPGYGWIMKMTRGIPVYPRSEGRTADITEAARSRIAEGLSILTYPEGHRTMDGRVQPFKRGVFFMARDAGIPVVPLAVHGLYEINHKGSLLFQPGTIDVYIGEQIETAGLSDEDIFALAEHLQRIVSDFAETGIVPDPANATPFVPEPLAKEASLA